MTTTPEQPTDTNLEDLAPDASIVDTILDLDDLLSAQVRRAEKTVPIYTRADLEGRIDELDEELSNLVDDTGKSLPDRVMDQRNPGDIAAEIQDLRRQYAASRVNITVRQMPSDDWDEFRRIHKDAIAKVGTSEEAGDEFWNLLIAATMVAKKPVTPDQVAAMRKKFGPPQIDLVGKAAWWVCTQAGVSVPFSQTSSAVLRQEQRATS